MTSTPPVQSPTDQHDNARPSARFYELETMRTSDLETLFLRGGTPDLQALAGWQFHGMNQPKWAKLLGIKKFIKGFAWESAQEDGTLVGHNSPVKQNSIHDAWIGKPNPISPKRFGFFTVDAVDATATDNKYLHAVLLDYGKGGNKAYDPTAALRDYLVQVDADNPDLYLGKAYFAVGPLRIRSNFFILERYREL